VKVRREVKERLERAGIKPGEVMKRALLDALADVEERELKEGWLELRGA